MTSPTSAPMPPVSAPNPTSANPSTAGAIASSNPTAGLTSSSTISSLADLKKKAPAVYKMMMEGIAMNICNEMQKHQERLKQIMREGERES